MDSFPDFVLNDNCLMSPSKTLGLTVFEFELKASPEAVMEFDREEVSSLLSVLRSAGLNQFEIITEKGMPLIIRPLNTKLQLILACLKRTKVDKNEKD